MGSRLRAVDAAGIERITDDYRRAARVAVEAGFDSIEVHVGHNYLLSAFLSPKLNKRDDQFGGSVENRARFARAVLRTVRDEVGSNTAVTAKLNMADGVDGGLWLEDSLEVATLFEQDGALDALELTGGSSLANPMYLFRGEAPMQEFAATLPPPVRLGFKVVGKRFLRSYPYEEAFFLPYARQFLAALVEHSHHFARAVSPSGRPLSRHSPKASPSSPWRVRCSGNRTCPTACATAARRPHCAFTATSACRPSTRAPVAFW